MVHSMNSTTFYTDPEGQQKSKALRGLHSEMFHRVSYDHIRVVILLGNLVYNPYYDVPFYKPLPKFCIVEPHSPQPFDCLKGQYHIM